MRPGPPRRGDRCVTGGVGRLLAVGRRASCRPGSSVTGVTGGKLSVRCRICFDPNKLPQAVSLLLKGVTFQAALPKL